MNERSELLTAEELAMRLHVRPRTICRWAKAGRIPRVRITAKVIRYDLAAVLDAVQADRGGAGTDV